MSLLQSTWQLLYQSFPPTSKFGTDQIPDLSGRVCVVTGGYTGIGKETTRALLQHNAKVYIAARSRAKAEPVLKELTTPEGNAPLFLQLDLAELASVRRCAEEFLSKETELHILFNNGGVLATTTDQLTADGYDLQFGTNVLGHWYLTTLLLPALQRGARSSPDAHARIITSSSIGHYFASPALDWETLKDSEERRGAAARQLYFQSKFGNVLMARELARRYADKGIISIAINPGNIKTELYRDIPSFAFSILNFFMLYPPSLGTLTQLYAGTMPEALEHNGAFMIPWARIGRARPEAYDPELARRLWEWMEEQVKQ
ncbi:NAD(P)-binding protein [Trametopsis cervina]|nr:NAD(P)-binding protein [Trametopsis cervina]